MSNANESPEVDDGWESDEEEAAGADQEETEASDASDTSGGESSPGGGRKRSRKRRAKHEEEYYPEDDTRAIAALEFLQRVVSEMQMDCQVHLRRPKDEDSDLEINLEIVGADSGRIIGKKGQVLGALQFLTNRVVNRPGLEKRHILVDAEGYRSRRDDSLATMAQRLGKQAVTDGKIITFEPMNPRDRRVVHLALAKFDGVVTKSDGEGDDRRVQIIPVRR